MTNQPYFVKLEVEPLEYGFKSVIPHPCRRDWSEEVNMYAIVECGGKQYKVEQDMLVKVEKIDAEVGATVELKPLLVADENGVRTGAEAEACKVVAQVNAQAKYPKVLVFHYNAKKQVRKRQGHSQPYTELKINSIEG